MKDNDTSVLIGMISKSEIFSGLSKSGLKSLAEKAEIRCYAKKQVIRSSRINPDGICFILSGSASVLKGKIIINTVSEGDTFGAPDLYKDSKSHLTDIIAASDCRIAVISKEEIDKLVLSDTAFAKGYISYLSDRIAFLTERIKTVTGGSATENLKAFIFSSEGGYVDCSNMSVLAKKLDMSRATLYRAIDSLESSGLIERKGNKIILLK